MKNLSRVVWSEGMYLGPHHFQVQNRYFEDSIRFVTSSLWFESYGLIGVELDGPGKQVVLDCMNDGLLLNCTHETVLRFLPPYIIGEREVNQAIKVLTKALKNFTPAPVEAH